MVLWIPGRGPRSGGRYLGACGQRVLNFRLENRLLDSDGNQVESWIMQLTDALKNKIDNMDYESMLSLWRFAWAGEEMFQDKSGEYFAEVLRKKRDFLSREEQVEISKRVGWIGTGGVK